METYLKETSQPVNIYLEANPNPNSLKFVANFMLLPEGESYDFPDAESAQNAPLAQKLFEFAYVRRVFYMSNFVTVTKDSTSEWAEIQDELKQYIKAYLESGKPLLLKENFKGTENIPEQEESEIVKNIKGILEEYVRPAVEQDGGAIQFHAYEDGVVKLLLQGSCSGCPASMVTLKGGIENLLKRMIPEIKSVEAEGI